MTAGPREDIGPRLAGGPPPNAGSLPESRRQLTRRLKSYPDFGVASYRRILEGWSQRACAIAAGHPGSQPAVTAIGTTSRRRCLRPSSGHDRLPESRRLVPLSLVRVQARSWAPRVLWSRRP